MAKVKDLTGQKFGRLTVLREGKRKGVTMRVSWVCKCNCGNIVSVTGTALQQGSTKSCGCYYKDSNKKHGLSKLPEYIIWQNMKGRCNNPKNKSFPNYGGRGIKVCERWLASFENFYADMGKRPSKKHTIDRIDNNAGYNPDNCKWSTRKQQANNTRNVTLYNLNGQKLSLAQWSRRTGIHRTTLSHRINKQGLTIAQAIEKG